MTACQLVVRRNKRCAAMTSVIEEASERATCPYSIAPNSCRAMRKSLRNKHLLNAALAVSAFPKNRFATMRVRRVDQTRRTLFDKVEIGNGHANRTR